MNKEAGKHRKDKRNARDSNNIPDIHVANYEANDVVCKTHQLTKRRHQTKTILEQLVIARSIFLVGKVLQQT